MARMHFSGDFVAVREDDSHQFQTFVNVNPHALGHSEPSWMAIDPALRSFHDEHMYPSKMLGSQPDNFLYYSSPSHSAQLAPFQLSDTFSQQNQSERASYFEIGRTMRYHSPGGPYGGTLSESSASEYPLSPDNTRNSMAFCNSPAQQSFQFAPLPNESQMHQHAMWPGNHSFTPLPTPLGDVAPAAMFTQAIALKELEVQVPSDYHHDQQFHEDHTNILRMQLPVQMPEELELSESLATLRTTGASTSMSSRTTDNGMSETEFSIKDNESDSDFDPRRKNSTVKQATVGHTHSRHASSLRSPRRFSTNNNNTSTTHTLLDQTSKVHKQPRSARTTSQTKDKPKSKPSPYSKKPTSPSSGEKPPRSFPCAFHAFGCASTFANKNEWKRHVSSQHLQLGYYRCDLGNCNPANNPRLISSPAVDKTRRRQQQQPSAPPPPPPPQQQQEGGDTITIGQDAEEEQEIIYNDFNRKDLFTQHCRRMHGPHRHTEDDTTMTNKRLNERVRKLQQNPSPKSKAKITVTKEDEAAFEDELETIRARCWTIRRKAPERSSCGFCGRLFSADVRSNTNDCAEDDGKAEEKAWEERMEHIGRHYERDGCSPHLETADDDLRDWGLKVGILHYIIDKDGAERVWLINYEPAPAHGDSPRHRRDEMLDVGSRESQRRRGLRRRLTGSTGQAPPARDSTGPTQHVMKLESADVKMETYDSESDADAEEE